MNGWEALISVLILHLFNVSSTCLSTHSLTALYANFIQLSSFPICLSRVFSSFLPENLQMPFFLGKVLLLFMNILVASLLICLNLVRLIV